MASSSTAGKLVSCVGYALRQAKKQQELQVASLLQQALWILRSEQNSAPTLLPCTSSKNKRSLCLDQLVPSKEFPVDRDSVTSECPSSSNHVPLDPREEQDNMQELLSPKKEESDESLAQLQEETSADQPTAPANQEHAADTRDGISVEVFDSPRSLIQQHLRMAADEEEAVTGLAYLRTTMFAQLRGEMTPSPQRTRLVQIYLEVCDQLRLRRR